MHIAGEVRGTEFYKKELYDFIKWKTWIQGCTCCSGWICSLYYQQELLATILCISTISDIKIHMFIHTILNKLT